MICDRKYMTLIEFPTHSVPFWFTHSPEGCSKGAATDRNFGRLLFQLTECSDQIIPVCFTQTSAKPDPSCIFEIETDTIDVPVFFLVHGHLSHLFQVLP